MEENFNGGQENHGERSDYAANTDSKAGYSSEGRKLRPRRKVSPAASSTADGEYRSYDNHRNHSSYSQGYGQRRSYGGDNEGGERRSYGQGRPSYGEGRSRSYGEGRPSYGQGRSSYGEGRQGGYSRSYNNNEEGGERRTFKPAGKKSFGPSQGFGGKGGSRPGARKFGHRKEMNFAEGDNAQINMMISRKPQVDDRAYSDNDNVPTPIKEEIRLNKYIANSGVCSRREADTYIQAGVVTVNGEVVTELGTKVNVIKDDIRFNGERLKGEKKVYIVMNKPKGFVTSASDPHAEKTVMDLLKGCTQRVFPVGRLDKSTTGVLMFTNDGELAEKLTHPSYNKKKIYQVILDKPLEEAHKDKILNEGLDLTTTKIKADELEYIDAEDHRRLGIEIHSGENRIVRRIFESLGYDVKALDRVYFAGLTKKGLKKGEWRFLSEGESNILKMEAYV